MNAKDAWLATLGQLQIQLNRSTYDTWLRHAELLGYEDGRFVVTVPHAYAKDWIERHLVESMNRTLRDIFRRDCEVQIIVWDPVDDEESPLLVEPEPIHSEQLNALNPAYTFKNLVVGQANHYAALLAKAVVENPAGKYSPVMFCGDMGVGKTHLLQAIARSLIERGDNVIYVTAEDFHTELVTAIRNQNNLAFRDKYRLADAVLIDDIQFIDGKNSTQNEVVAIWDALRNRQRTIIFASDRLPADMTKITKDARSRLQAGPIAVIEAPDLQMRRDLIDAFASRRGTHLSPDVRELIAARGESSGRDLEAAVEQLNTYSQLTRQMVTETVARTILHMRSAPVVAQQRTSANQSSKSGIGQRLEIVLEATARYYRLTVDDLASRQRTRVVAMARQLAMYLAREATDSSLIQIGDALGGRDHSTVMHGCAKIAEMLVYDQQLMQDVANIRQTIGSAKGVSSFSSLDTGFNSSANNSFSNSFNNSVDDSVSNAFNTVINSAFDGPDEDFDAEPSRKTTAPNKRFIWQ